MTELAFISNLDFFIRYACIGQLMLLMAYWVCRPSNKPSNWRSHILPLLLALGITAYLLLTAPYHPRPQGFIRSLLLLFTHCMPLLLWLYGKQLFDDEFNMQGWPVWAKSMLTILVIFYLYVFLVRGGGGHLQMLSHLIGLIFIMHLLASVIATWRNDLVEQRRIARFWFVLLVGLFFLMLDLVELSNTVLNRHPVFMLMNSSICWIGTSITAVLLFTHAAVKTAATPDSDVEANRYSRLLPQENALHAKLRAFIDKAGFLQSDLTISNMAIQLECPEHHLRKLINQRLGYTNFNAFLNHYRIEEARKRLVETSLPVLSIALDLGYGSIASFNRAFKDIVGITPTAYRTVQHAQISS